MKQELMNLVLITAIISVIVLLIINLIPFEKPGFVELYVKPGTYPKHANPGDNITFTYGINNHYNEDKHFNVLFKTNDSTLKQEEILLKAWENFEKNVTLTLPTSLPDRVIISLDGDQYVYFWLEPRIINITSFIVTPVEEEFSVLNNYVMQNYTYRIKTNATIKASIGEPETIQYQLLFNHNVVASGLTEINNQEPKILTTDFFVTTIPYNSTITLNLIDSQNKIVKTETRFINYFDVETGYSCTFNPTPLISETSNLMSFYLMHLKTKLSNRELKPVSYSFELKGDNLSLHEEEGIIQNNDVKEIPLTYALTNFTTDQSFDLRIDLLDPDGFAYKTLRKTIRIPPPHYSFNVTHEVINNSLRVNVTLTNNECKEMNYTITLTNLTNTLFSKVINLNHEESWNKVIIIKVTGKEYFLKLLEKNEERVIKID